MTTIKFALNHMTAPNMAVADFMRLAKSLGIGSIEIRNDLDSNAILDGTPPAQIRQLAEDSGLDIISINALQRFNEWSEKRSREAEDLIAYARECGAKALVLVPVNDGSGQGFEERHDNLREALSGLMPLLKCAGITGLVEPLGFEICSLRSKREALEGIADVGGNGVFRLVHDTFHHHLAGEPELFPDMTELVHISGVADPGVAVPDMRDSHRILVDDGDRLGNVAQMRALLAAGYAGPFSFEPFAASVHALGDPGVAVEASIGHIRAAI